MSGIHGFRSRGLAASHRSLGLLEESNPTGWDKRACCMNAHSAADSLQLVTVRPVPAKARAAWHFGHTRVSVDLSS